VFIQQDVLLSNAWNVYANTNDDINFKHNNLTVAGSVKGDSFLKTLLNSLDTVVEDRNYDIKFGFPFGLSIYSVEDNSNVTSYSNITYNSSNSTFLNFEDFTVSYSNLEESTDYTIVVSVITALGLAGSNYNSITNTGFDYPIITLDSAFTISTIEDMTISASNIRVTDKSSAVDLYYSIFTSEYSKINFEDELKEFYLVHNRGIHLTSNLYKFR
jgi:hypothetical protein